MTKYGILKESLEVSAGEAKHKVTAIGIPTEDGIIVAVLGGEKSHVGAIGLGIPRQSLTNPSSISSTSSILTLTGHKDDQIARPVAEELAREFKQAVVVVAGIHVEEATRKDIKILLANSKKAVTELEMEMKKRRNYSSDVGSACHFT